jgi:hypothetical protein
MDDEKKVSRFSSGLNILQRVDQIWRNCANFKRAGLYSKWNEELDTVWLELARDLKPEEYYDLDSEGKITNEKNKIVTEGYLTQFKKFETAMRELMPFKDSGSYGFGKPDKTDISNRNKQYNLLMDKQLFLARLENELGKGTSWEEEDDDF